MVVSQPVDTKTKFAKRLIEICKSRGYRLYRDGDLLAWKRVSRQYSPKDVIDDKVKQGLVKVKPEILEIIDKQCQRLDPELVNWLGLLMRFLHYMPWVEFEDRTGRWWDTKEIGGYANDVFELTSKCDVNNSELVEKLNEELVRLHTLICEDPPFVAPEGTEPLIDVYALEKQAEEGEIDG